MVLEPSTALYDTICLNNKMSAEEFEFPDVDEIGIETLEAISIAHNFNRWMYQTISPYCKGKILEIGSGIGNISKQFIQDNRDITLSDIRENYVNELKSLAPDNQVIQLNLTDSDFETKHKDLFGTYDTVFALNVVEHIKDDGLAIRNIKKLLRSNGNIVILVPAFQFLYNSFDTALEHYRRYTKRTLNNLFDTDCQIVHTQYFNVFGTLGWFVSGRLLKKKTIPVYQMKLYDRLLFITKNFDRLLLRKFGLSVITVATKK